MRLFKKSLSILAVAAALLSLPVLASAQLAITGVFDGPLPGGLPKGVELIALTDIPDLSIYGIGSANNGGGTDGEEFTFPADSAAQGDVIFVASEDIEFVNFFGFAPTYNGGGAVNINGDDAIELFQNGAVIDVIGDINMDGSGTEWDHLDGWAYRVSYTGPDGDIFVLANWTFSGINNLEGGLTNDTCLVPFPLGTFVTEVDGVVGVDNTTLDGMKAMYDR
jgi:hypothetical protein